MSIADMVVGLNKKWMMKKITFTDFSEVLENELNSK